MKKIILLLILMLLISSCNSVVEKPSNLIDDDTMIDIFYDLAIIDAGRNSSYESGVSNFKANDYIFKKYKIDSLQFAKSNRYWATDVSKYKRMFKAVKDKLDAKKAELEALSKAKNAVKK